MRASLKIELVGDNVNQLYRLWRGIANGHEPGIGDAVFGCPMPRWVAEITGTDNKYGLARQFLKSKKDYTKSNSIGSRGVFACYILDSGKVYEVCAGMRRRYFCTVTDSGDIKEIDRECVNEWIRSGSASTSTMPPGAE